MHSLSFVIILVLCVIIHLYLNLSYIQHPFQNFLTFAVFKYGCYFYSCILCLAFHLYLINSSTQHHFKTFFPLHSLSFSILVFCYLSSPSHRHLRSASLPKLPSLRIYIHSSISAAGDVSLLFPNLQDAICLPGLLPGWRGRD